MPKFFFVILLSFITNYCCLMERIDNICSTQHIKRVFLRLGESGVLTAHNVTHDISGNVSLREGCQVEIVTCPSCIISLTFTLMNLNCCCGSGLGLFYHNPCRCDYVWVTEPPYGSASGMSFCQTSPSFGKGLAYKSKTRIVRVSLFFSRAHLQAFTASYKSEPNRQVFLGTSQIIGRNLTTGYFSSPFFPASYPRDLTAEYVFTCITQANFSSRHVEDDSNCKIRLLFTDFQLASSSFMEFYEGNRRVSVVSGISFRPPVIVSATNSLSIRFYASGRSGVGFKAGFSFVTQKIMEKMGFPSTGKFQHAVYSMWQKSINTLTTVAPNSNSNSYQIHTVRFSVSPEFTTKPLNTAESKGPQNCGGYVDDFGGTITMMNMVPSDTKLFDCIWLIKPVKNFFSSKSHLYLKVTTFLDFEGDAQLEIRQGLTSESPLVEKLHHPVSQNFRELIIPVKSGFYVSLKATFGPESHFAVTYASFSQNKCLILSEFLCKNFRCISKKLTCDGFDHCGDNSDEPEICFHDWNSKPGNGRRDTQRPNYYFPKQFSDLRKTSVVFLASLVGLILLISALATDICRIRSKTRQRRNFHDEIQSIEDLRDTASDEVSIEDVLIDDPPSYEPPPNYEDVVKNTTRSVACDDSQQCPTKQW